VTAHCTLNHAARQSNVSEVLANGRGAFSYSVADVLRDRGVSVIFATGYSTSVLPERFRGTSVLLKPFDERQFAAAVQAALADSPCELELP
jgi:hypothetical protein